MKYIVSIGSLELGHRFFGPFDKYQDAVEWMEERSVDGSISPLLPASDGGWKLA